MDDGHVILTIEVTPGMVRQRVEALDEEGLRADQTAVPDGVADAIARDVAEQVAGELGALDYEKRSRVCLGQIDDAVSDRIDAALIDSGVVALDMRMI